MTGSRSGADRGPAAGDPGAGGDAVAQPGALLLGEPRIRASLAWHTGHLALFERYGGVPLWVRIDNLKTGVASGRGLARRC